MIHDSSLPIVAPAAFDARLSEDLCAANKISTLQINLGLVCNLACHHCHVDSSPKRSGSHENMSEETARRVMRWIAEHPEIDTIDLTGGSPEMNPNFRPLVGNAVC